MIYLGDLFTVLPTLPAESIDACVTDPPYGLGFMGKEWDTFKPGTGQKRRLMHPRERNAFDTFSPDRIKSAAAMKQRKNPEQLANLKNVYGRRRSPAMSPSQIEYDFTVAGLRGFQDWTARWAHEVFRVIKPGAYVVVCGGPRSHHRMMAGLEDAGFVVRDCLTWLFGSGFPKSKNLGDGRGTALKPAHEPIALVWKPFKGTIAANVEKHGTGALNIDACRIGGPTDTRRKKGSGPSAFPHSDDAWVPHLEIGGQKDQGRWPANVLLDELAAEMLDAQTGELATHGGGSSFGIGYGRGSSDVRQHPHGDSGGASRFYYVAKTSRRERDRGCDDLVVTTGGEATDRKDGSAGLNNPRAGAGRTGGARNIHPTVKPVELMRWLVRLITPPHGTVLDPFMGSGTTGMACRLEGRTFIGIEKEAQYVEIARRRIGSVRDRSRKTA